MPSQRLHLPAAISATLFLSVTSTDARSQAKSDPNPDTLTVTAKPLPGRALPPQVELTQEALAALQATSVADALRGLPGVSARTNSRGETIARVRGADERQTAVFFDGAPFSVPWDGRIDIGVLPAGLLGRVKVTKGAAPIEYGANAVGGVVDLQSRRGGSSGNDVFVTLDAGTAGHRQLSAVKTFSVAGGNGIDVTLAGGHIERDALPVADRGKLPFSQPDASRRTNTDLASNSGFAALGARLGKVDARVSVLHNRTERGIAPESDRDPAVAAPRYWRYPEIELTQATMNLHSSFGEGDLSVVLHRQWFNQTIDSYRAVDYTTLASRQEDDDNTWGARLTADQRFGAATLRLNASTQVANHKQVDTAFPSAVAGPRLEYEQQLSSLGVEVDMPAGSGRLTIGAALDRSRTPLTGDKPAQSALQAPAFSAAFQQRLSPEMDLSASIGRRTRFASARELFGESLGRFLINPDLEPEKAWLADVELRWKRPAFEFSVSPFLVRGTDTISQRMVRVNNVNRRQRINLKGTRTVGVDSSYARQINAKWQLELGATVSRALADAGDAEFRKLVQRPEHEVSLGATWTPHERLSVSAKAIRTGRAEDDSPIAGRVTLPASTEYSLKAKWLVTKSSNGSRISLTLAGDNLGNAHIEPQLGLPRAGRTIRFGLLVD